MQLLTAPNLNPDSAAVDWISGVLGNPSPENLAIFLGAFVLLVYIVKSVAGILVLRWTTTFALSQETRTVHRLMSVYLRAPYRVHLTRNTAEYVRTLTTSA